MKCESWVPVDAVNAWNVVLKQGLENAARLGSNPLPMNKVHPDSRASVRLMNIRSERSVLGLEVIPSLFTKFMTNNTPESLWVQVDSSKYFTPWEFMCEVTRAYTGPSYASEVMTTKERDSWKKKTSEKAAELGALVASGRVNHMLDTEYHNLQQGVLNTLNHAGIPISDDLKMALSGVFFDAPLLSTMMGSISNSDDPESFDLFECPDAVDLYFDRFEPDMHMSKPNDPQAHRYYFIQRMTRFFGERTGGPKRALVQILVCCLFGDIDERKVVEIAPWIPKVSG